MTALNARIAALLLAFIVVSQIAVADDDRDSQSLGAGPAFRSQSDVLAWRSAWRRSLAPTKQLGEWRLEVDREISISQWRTHVSDEARRNVGSDQTFIIA